MFSRLFTVPLIAALLVTGSWRETAVRGAAVRGAASSPPPYVVVIVMDGFRPDYATLAPMRHLRALIARGMSYDSAWVGQIESETPSGHATIATGVYPRKHGVIGFGWRDIVTGVFTYLPTNLGQLKAGAMTHTVEQGGVPTISDLIHARNRHDLAISVSGEKLWASAPMGVGADYVLYGTEVAGKTVKNKFQPFALGPNIPPARTRYKSVQVESSAFNLQDGFAAQLARVLAGSLRPRVLFVNLPASDIAGHYYGGIGQPHDMAMIVRGADAAIGKIVNEYKRLGILKQTVFVVTADHGMVTGRHRVPIHAIYDTVRTSGVQQLDQELRNSAGSIWLKDPEHAKTLATGLARKHFAGVEGVLYKAPAGGGSFKFVAEPSTAKQVPPAVLHAYLNLADTEASNPGADILLPYPENTTGLPLTHRFQGMHGGFSWGSQHIPLVIAGPGVRAGHSHFPAKLVDVAPTIERLAGLQIPSGVDGIVLADAVSGAGAPERAAQTAVTAPRLADVHALQQHSASQTR